MKIYFRPTFNQPIDFMLNLINLKYVRFSERFNQKISNYDILDITDTYKTFFPKNIETLIFGQCFNQPINSMKMTS